VRVTSHSSLPTCILEQWMYIKGTTRLVRCFRRALFGVASVLRSPIWIKLASLFFLYILSSLYEESNYEISLLRNFVTKCLLSAWLVNRMRTRFSEVFRKKSNTSYPKCKGRHVVQTAGGTSESMWVSSSYVLLLFAFCESFCYIFFYRKRNNAVCL
jgi:hypothetical protein